MWFTKSRQGPSDLLPKVRPRTLTLRASYTSGVLPWLRPLDAIHLPTVSGGGDGVVDHGGGDLDVRMRLHQLKHNGGNGVPDVVRRKTRQHLEKGGGFLL